jgi:triosephosphate isomerase
MGAARKIYIIGNWKMNFSPGEASLYLHRLSDRIQPSRSVNVILAPSSISLQSLSLQINRRQFKLAAQNFYWQDFGAYTGETSISQLRGIVDYAIIGHSERRHIFRETDKDVRAKMAAAIRNNIRPVLCIGETADERKHGETKDALHDQLVGGLQDVADVDINKCIIAYEPVWAIGTGVTASNEQAQEACKLIRDRLAALYGKAAADAITIQYGGSMNAGNAAELLAKEDVDGGLIGGASLKAGDFGVIIKAATI